MKTSKFLTALLLGSVISLSQLSSASAADQKYDKYDGQVFNPILNYSREDVERAYKDHKVSAKGRLQYLTNHDLLKEGEEPYKDNSDLYKLFP